MEVALYQAIVAVSAAVTAVASLGGFQYIRRTREDASKAVRLLEGTRASAGIIERVEDVEAQAEQNTHATARCRRALRREGMLNPDTTHDNAD